MGKLILVYKSILKIFFLNFLIRRIRLGLDSNPKPKETQIHHTFWYRMIHTKMYFYNIEINKCLKLLGLKNF